MSIYSIFQNLGEGFGAIASGASAQDETNRKTYESRALAAFQNGDIDGALKYAKMAHPNADIPQAPGTMRTKGVAAPPPPAIPGVPTPDQMAHLGGLSQQRQLGITPVAQMGIQPGGQAAKLPTSLSGVPDAAAPTMANPTGVNPAALPSLKAPATVDVTTEDKSTPNYKDPAFVGQLGAFLGAKKPDPTLTKVEGQGLVAYTPSFGGLPGSLQTVMPEKIGPKDQALIDIQKWAQTLDAAKIKQHGDLTRLELNLKERLAGNEDATRRFVALLGDQGDRFKALLAAGGIGADGKPDYSAITAGGKAGKWNTLQGKLETAKLLATAATGKYDPLTGDEAEWQARYDANFTKALKALDVDPSNWGGEGGAPVPAAPGAAPSPEPTPAGGSWFPNNGFGGRPGAPSPSPSPSPGPSTLLGQDGKPNPIPSSVPKRGNIAGAVYNYAPIIEKYARPSGVDPRLVAIMLDRESAGNPKAKGTAVGEYGLMQISPFHFDGKGIPEAARWDPETNIRMGIGILAGAIKASGGNIREGVRRYNGSGPMAERYADEVMAAYEGRTAPTGKPTPNGATPRMQKLLNQTKPREQK